MLNLTAKSERKHPHGPSSGILPQLGLSGKGTERQRQYRCAQSERWPLHLPCLPPDLHGEQGHGLRSGTNVATFRARMAALVRRGRALARQPALCTKPWAWWARSTTSAPITKACGCRSICLVTGVVGHVARQPSLPGSPIISG